MGLHKIHKVNRKVKRRSDLAHKKGADVGIVFITISNERFGCEGFCAPVEARANPNPL